MIKSVVKLIIVGNFEKKYKMLINKLKGSHKIIVASLLIGLQACTEKGVVIDFSDPASKIDTTYIAPVETPQLKNVLIEEFTGASCTNCPTGHEVVKNMLTGSNGSRLVALAYHTFNGGTIFQPVNKIDKKSKFDFRDSAATKIGETIYEGLTSIPTAGIDRVMKGTSRKLPRTQWVSEFEAQLVKETPVNLSIQSKYDAGKNEVTLNIKIAYTKAMSAKNVLTLGVVENKIIDAQEYPTYVEMDYDHSHVFRKCLTNYSGMPILDSIVNKEAGRVYEYTMQFQPSTIWNLDNCYIVGFVSNNEATDKTVLQAIETKLK
jgi:hypothetical protein